MAVYKRNYRAYAGRVQPPRWRWLRITRYSLAELFSSRITGLLFAGCLAPMLVWAATIYLVNSDTARMILGMQGVPMLTVNNTLFFRMLQAQGWLALFLTAWIGPAMISPDLTNGALPLYLSRPISRAEYVGGKLLVLVLMLSAVTWMPLMMLFGMQAAMSKTPWLGSNLYIANAILLGSCIWIALLALLALALSAWVKWRIVAMGLVLAIIFIPAGFGAVASEILRTKWGLLLNFPYLITLIWSRLLNTKWLGPFAHIPVIAAWIMLLAMSAVCLMLLNQRIRARQVVRG